MNIENKLELIKSLTASSDKLNKAAMETILAAYSSAKEKAGIAGLQILAIREEHFYGTMNIEGLKMWVGSGAGRHERTIDTTNAHRYLNLALQAIEAELNRVLDACIDELKTATTIKD